MQFGWVDRATLSGFRHVYYVPVLRHLRSEQGDSSRRVGSRPKGLQRETVRELLRRRMFVGMHVGYIPESGDAAPCRSRYNYRYDGRAIYARELVRRLSRLKTSAA